jgi:N-acetylneuraminic acid mutarotase
MRGYRTSTRVLFRFWKNHRKYFAVILSIIFLIILASASGHNIEISRKVCAVNQTLPEHTQIFDISAATDNRDTYFQPSTELSRPDNFYLRFPVPNRHAESVIINSVMDHSNTSTEAFYRPDGQITTYDGEAGESNNGEVYVTNFGYGALYQMRNLQHSSFVLNGSVGDSPTYLAYDGHQGFDFKTLDQTNIASNPLHMLAAEGGTLTCLSDGVKTAVIDHGNNFRTRYLHMTDRICENGPVQVSAGQQIGRIFNSGTGGIHAHFEVQAFVNGQWRTVDPYGWRGQYRDPRGDGTSTNLWKPIASTADKPTRWHPNGLLVSDITDNNHTVYLIQNYEKWGIPSESVFYAYGFDFANVIKISPEEFDHIPWGGILSAPPSSRLRNSGGTIYEIIDRGGQLYKRGFPTLPSFYGQGFKWDDIQSQSVAGIPDDSYIPVYSSQFRDGTLIGELDETVTPAIRRLKQNTPVYLISKSTKRAFDSETAFMNIYGSTRAFDDVVLVKKDILLAIATGPNICESTTVGGGSCGGGFTTDVYPPSLLIRQTLFGSNFEESKSSLTSNTESILLMGTGTDSESGDNGIQSVKINGVLASNGTAVGSGIANWSKTIQLNPGLNTILVEVTDNSSNHNRSQQTITIDYQPPENDTDSPFLTVSSPTPGEDINTSLVTVIGTASDGNAGDNGISSVTVNGIPATGGVATGSDIAHWSATINVSSGNNAITVIARDGSSNHNLISLTFGINGVTPGQTTIPLDYSWVNRQPPPVPLEASAMVTMNEKIYLLGGRGAGANSANRFYRYDPASNQWETLPDIPNWGIVDGSATVLNGKIYAFRSFHDNQPGGDSDYSLKIYDPANNAWTTGANLPLGQIYGTALVTIGDKLLAIGGANQFLTGLSAVNEYDPIGNTWTSRAPMPRPRGFASVHVIRGLVYVIGGIGTDSTPGTNLVDIYDPSSDTWGSGSPAPFNFWNGASTVIAVGNPPLSTSYRIIIMGGTDDSFSLIPFVFEYNPDAGTWRQLSSLPAALSAARGAVVNGNLYFVGGGNGTTAGSSTFKGTPLEWAPDLTVSASLDTFDTNTNGSLFVRLGSTRSLTTIVTLSSSNPTLISVPSSVTFNIGETLKAIPIQSSQINTGSVVITAQLPVAQGGGISSTTIHVVARAPSVLTDQATQITSTAATLNGTVNPNFAETNAWFQLSTDYNFNNFNSVGFQNLGSTNNFVPLTYRVENLLPNTTYYFKVVAANNGGWNIPHIYYSFTTGPNVENHTKFDFDGDGKTDVSVFRPSNGGWFLQRSNAGFYGVIFGGENDKIAPADYDGDGKTDIAIYRPSEGNWYVLNSSNGIVSVQRFGLAGDIPVPGDFDGDGKDDVNLFRNLDSTWYHLNSSNGAFVANQFGLNGDKPQAGDFNGDGKADIAVFRPSSGVWYWINSGSGTISILSWGLSTDLPVPADYEGDGKTDVAIYRPSQGSWYILRSSDGGFLGQAFGLATDIPSPGDFDGDGKADVAIFRPSDGNWWINRTKAGVLAFPFGINGDKPTPSAFVY